MEIIKQYQIKLIEMLNSIEQHGYGKVSVEFEEARDYRVKVVIKAGKSYVYFVKKEVKFDETQII